MIKVLEKGHLYKVKECPYWDKAYTIFCAKLTRKVNTFNDYRLIPFMFAIYGSGKSAHINISRGINEVRVVHGRYVKRLTANDYLKASRLLKSKGYRYDKKTMKLVNLNP